MAIDLTNWRKKMSKAINPSTSQNLELKPKITVVGVGGAGGNAVNNMIRSNLQGVEFVVCNTDAQALEHASASHRIQLGTKVTQGLGAGSRPEVGRAAAEESHEELSQLLAGSNMVFITAGMGGGTGTGAAPVVAQFAREQGILTVAVVTKPFHFEGRHRMRTAEYGIEELAQFVDTLIVIPNQNLFRVANDRTTFAEAFKMADDVLHSGVRGITDLMIMPGLINLDFADIRAVMMEMGKAMMGTGEAEGEGRAIAAAEAAISNPLLDDVSMKGAQALLINITGGMDMTLFEVDEAANRIREEVDPDANIIFGSTFNETMNGRMRVSVVATGIESEAMKARKAEEAKQKNNISQVTQAEKGIVQGFFTRRKEEENDLFNPTYRPDTYDVEQLEEKQSHEEAFTSEEPKPLILDTEEGQLAGENKEMAAEATRSRKLGFFERVAETMRGSKSQRSEIEPMIITDSVDNEDQLLSAQGMAANTEQKELEIPTFLRRGAKK